MSEYRAIIEYLKNCYQADNRELGLTDFYSRKVEHRWLLTESSLLTGDWPVYPVDPEWGAAVEKTLAVYQKEKELVLSYLFLTGEMRLGNKLVKVVTPLFFIPTILEKRDLDFFVKLIPGNASVNPFALTLLSTLSDETDIAEELIDWVTQGDYLFGDLGNLRKLLTVSYPALNAQALLMYPTFFDKKAIQLAREKPEVHLLPTAGMGVLRKSTTTLGVLSELEALMQTEDYSAGLMAFLHASEPIQASDQPPLVPAVLSKAQERVFSATTHHTLSQITGPPGTGKSFMIASLAINAMHRGESVLIVSSNDQAVDVVYHKIKEDFHLEQIAVRGGGKRDYKSLLKQRLENWLSGIGVDEVENWDLLRQKKTTTAFEKKLTQLGRQYQKAETKALRWGRFLYGYQEKWWQWLPYVFLQERIKQTRSMGEILSDYQQMLAQYHQAIKEQLALSFNYQLYQTLLHHRGELRKFLSGIRARTSSRKDDLFERISFQQISRTLPVWLVPISEISHVLPFQKELFDTVIIDEATQCDIASILPVLQRAKRVVVAGDPKQLRHVCFLAKRRQEQLAASSALSPTVAEQFDYRNDSVLDVANRHLPSQEAVVFLDEHFRSQPSIIAFSNAHFYQNQLRIMTTHPRNEATKHVYLKRTSGAREAGGHNEEETRLLIEKIRTIASEEAQWEATACRSIGVLSPFRQQVAYVRKQIALELEAATIARHRLLVGTPYSFQGEERDVMLISLAVDHHTHPSAFQLLGREDVFNVSITRARSEQWVYTSLHQSTGYAAATLLEKYLSSIEEDALPALPEKNHYQDDLLTSVVAWLSSKGMTETHQQYTLAGIEIDLVVVYQEHVYGISLVGHPGDLERAFSIEQCRILQRIGVPVFPLSYSHWRLSEAKTKQALLAFLGIL